MSDSSDDGNSPVIQKTLTGLLREDNVKAELAHKLEAQGKKVIYVEREKNAPYKKTSMHYTNSNERNQLNQATEQTTNNNSNNNVYNDPNDGANDMAGGLPPRIPTEVEDYQRVQSSSPANQPVAAPNNAVSPQQQQYSPQQGSVQGSPQAQAQAPSQAQYSQQTEYVAQPGAPGAAGASGQAGGGGAAPPMMSDAGGGGVDTSSWVLDESTTVTVKINNGVGSQTGTYKMSQIMDKIVSGELEEDMIQVSLNNGSNWVELETAIDNNRENLNYEIVNDPNYEQNVQTYNTQVQEAQKQGKPLPPPPKKRKVKKKGSGNNKNTNNNASGKTNSNASQEEIVPGFEPGEPDMKAPSSGCCVVL